MSPREYGLALFVAFLWGASFIAIKIGVTDMPPLLFSAARFFFAAVPAVFLLKPPKTPARLVIAYGLAIGVAQFGLLFIAIRLGMPTGLSSLVIQAHVIFTMFFAWLRMGEPVSRAQLVGVAIAILGLGVIGAERLAGGGVGPFLLLIGAAAAWGVGNIVGKRAGRVDMLAFIVWSSLVAPPCLLALSLAFEGGEAIHAITHPELRPLMAAALLGYVATLVGYTLWAHLLSRHPAALIAPFALLVPVFGFLAGRIAFNERASAPENLGAVLVLAGVGWTVLGGRAGALIRRGPRAG